MNSTLHTGMSRRELIRSALATGVAAALARGAGAQTPAGALNTKPIPGSGQQLPVIGIGTNAFRLSNLDTVRSLLSRFHELGAQVIDTAAMYGDSESAIGQALADLGIRKQLFIATKLMSGPMRMGPQLYGAESFEHSLKVLQTDYVDLLQVHSMVGIDTLMPQLVEWKKAGRIRYIGTTTSESSDHAKLLECMQKYPLDFIQVNYSIGNRDAAAQVLPTAIARKIAVLVNVPLGGRGAENIAASRNRPLPPWVAALGIGSWAQFMLKYVVSHPAVTATIPGSTKLEHLEDNQLAGRGTLPDAATRLKMEAYWDTQV